MKSKNKSIESVADRLVNIAMETSAVKNLIKQLSEYSFKAKSAKKKKKAKK